MVRRRSGVRFGAPWLVLVALSAALPAQQVFVVDASNGPGTHFTDLPPAIAAVPGGSVLIVRPGAYSPFDLSKGLVIAGEDAATVLVNSSGSTPMVIGNTVPGQRILLRNLTLSGLGTPIEVRDAGDAVIFENVHVGFVLLTDYEFRIERSTNVQFHRCDLTASYGSPTSAGRISAVDSSLQISYSAVTGTRGRAVLIGNSYDGSPALGLTRSRCVAVASTLVGGLGGAGCANLGLCNALPGNGGPGASVQDSSTLLALRTPVRGADGLAEFTIVATIPASNGGDGIHVRGSSSARFEGAEPIGGAGGSGQPPGLPGVASVVEPGSTLAVDTGTYPASGEIVGAQARGQTVEFTLDARPASSGWLILSYDPRLVPVEPLAQGSLLATFVVSIGPLAVPASGILQVPIATPTTWPIGQTYYGQFVTLEPGPTLWVSNSFPWHTNR